MKWQPIETAPKAPMTDKPIFIITMALDEVDGVPQDVKKNAYLEGVHGIDDLGWMMNNTRSPEPTHWIPIPEVES